MKVGIDGRVLYGKYQGTRTYLSNILNTIEKKEDTIDFILFRPKNEECLNYERIKTIVTDSGNRTKDLLYGMGLAVKGNKIDVFYSQYISPFYCPCNKVVAIHDVLPITHKEYFPRGFSFTRKHGFYLSALNSDQIHTVSEYSKESLIDCYGISPEKLHVIPNGVDSSKFTALGRKESRLYLTNTVGESDVYMLTVGRVEPRKNYYGLIEGLSILKDEFEEIRFKLVIIGHLERGIDEIKKLIHFKKLENDVIFLSGVDDLALSKIYRGSDLFVYPSIAEGFGIPPLEAMAAGTPVVSSNTTAMPEVLSDAALYFDPFDKEDMLNKIKTIIFNRDLQDELVEKGNRRVKLYTWENTVRKYLSALKKLN